MHEDALLMEEQADECVVNAIIHILNVTNRQIKFARFMRRVVEVTEKKERKVSTSTK